MNVFRFLFVCILVFSQFSTAQSLRYEKQLVRDKLFDLAANPPTTNVVIEGDYATPEARAFMDYYLTVIRPREVKLSLLGYTYGAYNLLVDSGSYNDEAESQEFQAKMLAAADEWNQYSVDPAVTAELKEWARLSEGLTGDLADNARRAARERELEEFPEAMKPLLSEIDTLQQEFELALNNAPGNAALQEFSTARSEASRAFKAGEIDWAEATRRINEIYQKGGYERIGKEGVLAKGENLNRIAVIRSQLAKAKGFKTWAEYMTEMNGQGYEPAYRGPAQQREILKKLIAAARPRYQAIVNDRLLQLGIPSSELRYQYISLLSYNSFLQIRDHFPTADMTNMWEQTMLASGFKPETLSQILVDDEFRQGKNRTMAYMSGILDPYLDNVTINAVTLNVVQLPVDSPLWRPGFQYILQSYKAPGVSDLETAFHEGGHALEGLLRFQQVSSPSSYGYVEIPSMTMEYFTRDPEVLYGLAKEVNGKKPDLAYIRELAEGAEKNGVFTIMALATDALYDTDIWDYDYAAPGAQTFLQRAEQLDSEIARLAGDPADIAMPAATWYQRFATTHFTSGSVRYMGYVYAEIGSRMMADFIYDELERTTGRRTWNAQPGLADIFTKKFFQVGWKKLFPTNIEEITGRKFDPATF